MSIKPTLMIIALLSLTACQGGLNSYQAHTGACTQHPYDAGFCEQQTNWHLGSLLSERQQDYR